MERHRGVGGTREPAGAVRERLPHPFDRRASGERLTEAAERDLARRARTGDEKARDRLIGATTSLVVRIASRYASHHLERQDLIQEGLVGLCIALDHFDPTRDVRFKTYAAYWIRQRMLRALEWQGRMIRLPAEVAAAARRAHIARSRLTDQLGREPTLGELAERLGIAPGRLEFILASLEEPVSLDAPLGEDSELPVHNLADPSAPNPEEMLLRSWERQTLVRLLAGLPARDRFVLEARFGLRGGDLSPDTLARQLAVSPASVRQIQRRALLKLRQRWTQRELLGA